MREEKPSLIESILNPIKALAGAVMADGTIKAAAVQGVDEIGVALKAFPDAVQTHATGTVFHPLQSELAKDRGVFDRDPSPDQGKSPVAQAMEASRDPNAIVAAGQDVEHTHGR